MNPSTLSDEALKSELLQASRRERNQMTSEQANLIYDLLTVACGAREHWRGDFVQHFTGERCSEYRCCESLGTGGKFYSEVGRWRVGCYREDDTEERCQIIQATNRVLAALRIATQNQ